MSLVWVSRGCSVAVPMLILRQPLLLSLLALLLLLLLLTLLLLQLLASLGCHAGVAEVIKSPSWRFCGGCC